MVANLEILSIGQMSLFHVADHIASLDVVSTSHSTCFVMKKVKHLTICWLIACLPSNSGSYYLKLVCNHCLLSLMIYHLMSDGQEKVMP